MHEQFYGLTPMLFILFQFQFKLLFSWRLTVHWKGYCHFATRCSTMTAHLYIQPMWLNDAPAPWRTLSVSSLYQSRSHHVASLLCQNLHLRCWAEPTSAARLRALIAHHHCLETTGCLPLALIITVMLIIGQDKYSFSPAAKEQNRRGRIKYIFDNSYERLSW